MVQSIEGGGWGGRPFEDGESGTVSVCQGDVRNGSIEGIELKCPVLVESRALRTDSGGAGKYRGGLGIDMRVRNLVEGTLEFRACRGASKCPPWGLWGGTPGEPGGYLLRLPGENEFTLAWAASHHPGAGRLRSHRAHRRRRRLGRAAGARSGAGACTTSTEEFISRRGAEEAYGVVLRDNLTLDEAADRAAAKCAKIWTPRMMNALPGRHARET